MNPMHRKTVGDALFFLGGPLFFYTVFGLEGFCGYGGAIIFGVFARAING
jgi:hypothetical protein